MIRFFFICLSILIANGIRAEYSIDPYKQVTTKRSAPVKNEYFGMHFHRLVLDPNEKKLLTRWPDKFVGAIRLWDSRTRWADIAPTPGVWSFDRLDSYVEQAIFHKVPILYVLGSTPRWASARPDESCPYGKGCAAEPIRLAHWEEYVRRVSQRYRGKIYAYELWNEPFFSDLKNQKGESDFFYGPVSTMVELARLARKVIDEVDPQAILTTPGFTGNPNQLELFLSKGGKQYIQVVAFHFYSKNVDEFAKQVLDVRAVMKRQGVEHLPLWNTETGLEVHLNQNISSNTTPAWSRKEAASHMAQFLVFGAAADLERYYYHAWDNERSGMLFSDGNRQPAWYAYEKINAWLRNAVMLGCESIRPNGVRCQGEKDGKRFLIVWAKKEGMHRIPIDSTHLVASIETLFSTPLESVISTDNSLKLMLGSEPVQILLDSK